MVAHEEGPQCFIVAVDMFNQKFPETAVGPQALLPQMIMTDSDEIFYLDMWYVIISSASVYPSFWLPLLFFCPCWLSTAITISDIYVDKYYHSKLPIKQNIPLFATLHFFIQLSLPPHPGSSGHHDFGWLARQKHLVVNYQEMLSFADPAHHLVSGSGALDMANPHVVA